MTAYVCQTQMGHATAEAVVRAGLPLVPFTLTGYSAGVAVSNIGVSGIPVERVGKERRQEVIEQVKLKYPSLLVIDYTTPSCVNGGWPGNIHVSTHASLLYTQHCKLGPARLDCRSQRQHIHTSVPICAAAHADNAAFYAANGIPFIMGTTGGDRERVLADARAAGVYAVVAPQMGKQVVAFQVGCRKAQLSMIMLCMCQFQFNSFCHCHIMCQHNMEAGHRQYLQDDRPVH